MISSMPHISVVRLIILASGILINNTTAAIVSPVWPSDSCSFEYFEDVLPRSDFYTTSTQPDLTSCETFCQNDTTCGMFAYKSAATACDSFTQNVDLWRLAGFPITDTSMFIGAYGVMTGSKNCSAVEITGSECNLYPVKYERKKPMNIFSFDSIIALNSASDPAFDLQACLALCSYYSGCVSVNYYHKISHNGYYCRLFPVTLTELESEDIYANTDALDNPIYLTYERYCSDGAYHSDNYTGTNMGNTYSGSTTSDQRINGHTISSDEVRSLTDCARSCHVEMVSCVAVNFNSTSKVCELLDITESQASGSEIVDALGYKIWSRQWG